MESSLFQRVLKNIPQEVRFYTQYAGDLAMAVGELLAAKGITQREFADKLGMKESQLSRVLSGTGNPTLKTIARFSAALDEDLLRFPAFERWEEENPSYYATLTLEIKGVTHTLDNPVNVKASSYYYESAERRIDRTPVNVLSLAA